MKIAVQGAAGSAGKLIASEALSRGFDVTVIDRDKGGLTAPRLEGLDAVVYACAPGEGPSLEDMIALLEEHPKVRLLVLGSAGSLYTDETKSGLVLDTLPDGERAEGLELLKKSGVNWTYFSPAPTFLPEGRRTGKYILGTDYQMYNSMGEASLSYADCALAIVDELAEPKFIRRRFTAVSDTSFVQTEPGYNLFNIASLPFIRRGSYFGVYCSTRGGMTYAEGKLSVRSRRGAKEKAGGNEFAGIFPVYKGLKVPYAIRTTATELELITAYGKITLCYPESRLLYIKGENGLSLKFEKSMVIHEVMKPRPKGAWEQVLRWHSTMIYTPIKGHIEMDAPWQWERLTTPIVKGEILPDEDGCFLLAMEEFRHAGAVRESYPDYASGLLDAKSDWESFLSTIPRFGGALDEKRERLAYILWSNLVGASGRIKRPMLYMTPEKIGSSWQMSMTAAALRGNMGLAAELLLAPLDAQSPYGQIPDSFDDLEVLGQSVKPPVEGWAFLRLLKNNVKLPADKLPALYEGWSRWADWFTLCRDDDKDGVPQYELGDESGFDDATLFMHSPVIDSPDLSAYLVLLYEALGELAGMLLKPDEAKSWSDRSKALLQKLINKFWNGEKFVAFAHGTGKTIDTDSILPYLPLILGKRLPGEIIDKMAADLSIEGAFLTPFGLASERLTSEDYRASGLARGFVLPQLNLLLVTGLHESGKTELAKKIAGRYCEALRNSDFSYKLSPMSFAPVGACSTWGAAAYLILAELAANR